MTDIEREKDKLYRYIFENTQVRGELVQLDESWQAVLARCDYPLPLRKLLGETMAVAALLSATIKFDGKLTIQAQGEGPVSLLLVQCNSKKHIRGLINWNEDYDINDGSLRDLFGKGHLAITIEPEDEGERYQGVVDLDGNCIADAVEEYFGSSEQIQTKIWLACDENSAAGLMIQKMPGKESDPDAWDRMVSLSNTIKDTELLVLPVRDLIERLFSQETVRLFDSETFEFRCTCNQEKLESVLNSIGIDDVTKLIEEKGIIEVVCEYCGKKYVFDRVDVEYIFSEGDCVKGPNTKQ